MPIVGTTPGGDPPGRGPRRVRPGAGRGRPARAHGTASPTRAAEAVEVAREIGYPVLVRPSATCSAAAAWRSSTTTRRSRRYVDAGHRGARPSTRCWSTGSSTTPSRSTSTRSTTARDVPRRRHGAHRGGRHPLRRLGLRPAAGHAGRTARSTGSAARPRPSPRASACGACSTSSSPSAADVLYVLEANPRASRTVPFVSKATAVPLAKAAARIDARRRRSPSCGPRGCCRAHGRRHAPAAGRAGLGQGGGAAVQAVPHPRGRSSTRLLGPEMRSTGEVMGIDDDFGTAFAKSQAAAYGGLPDQGHASSSRSPTATSGR